MPEVSLPQEYSTRKQVLHWLIVERDGQAPPPYVCLTVEHFDLLALDFLRDPQYDSNGWYLMVGGVKFYRGKDDPPGHEPWA